MPSTYNNSSTPSLSWILGLELTRDPRCVGYDISIGHRCDTETTPRNRGIAQTFVDMATAHFGAGRGVDYLLEVIAPRVLCGGEDHQRQAPVLVARWAREIAAFEALDNNDPRPVPGGTHTYDTTRAMYDYHAPLDVDSRRCRMYQRIKDTVQELREQIRDIHPWGTNPGFPSFTHFPGGRDPALQEDNGGAQYGSTFGSYYRPYIEPASYTVEPLSNYAESSYTEQPSAPPASTYEPHRQPVEGDCSICLGSLHEAPLLPKPNPATSWQWSPTDSAPSADDYEN